MRYQVGAEELERVPSMAHPRRDVPASQVDPGRANPCRGRRLGRRRLWHPGPPAPFAGSGLGSSLALGEVSSLLLRCAGRRLGVVVARQHRDGEQRHRPVGRGRLPRLRLTANAGGCSEQPVSFRERPGSGAAEHAA